MSSSLFPSSQFLPLSQFPLTQVPTTEAEQQRERDRQKQIFQSITLHNDTQRYMVEDQDPNVSMLQHLNDMNYSFSYQNGRNNINCFDNNRVDVGAVGFRNMGHNTVLILACKEAVIVGHFASDHGSDCLVHAQRESVNQDAREMIETIGTALDFYKAGGKFTKPSEYYAWMIGTITGGGRIDQAMNSILDDGLFDLGFLPHYHQYVQPTNPNDTNPGLGTVLFFNPANSSTDYPVIFVDDKMILKP
ncbi:hypothetical protein SEUCBS139899_002167 [Sporothrix eucalyptigena]|uniref:Uncharacterized protein n=1 Tax=Sporothrix eucalyptigena TaxID=1812306 RepID=A0ABP0B4S2_9PEZI